MNTQYINVILDHFLQGANIEGDADHAIKCMKKMIAIAEDLVPKMVDVKEKEIGDLVDNEMSSTTAAIEEAARRIAVSLFFTSWLIPLRYYPNYYCVKNIFTSLYLTGSILGAFGYLFF